MAPAKVWRALQRDLFPQLPLDCGNRSDPGVIYSEDLRDWSDKATTPDQTRMERYIDRYDLRDKRVLHIGIGNSGLARRFHRYTREIVGTTIDEPEIKVARALSLPNYRFVLHNKYSRNAEAVPGKFDFILDNNPTSPCCCIRHLTDLFGFYSAKLAEGGQVVTDRQGLEWIPEGSNPRWSFAFDDLTAVAAAVGLKAFRANRTVYVLSHDAPSRPSRGAVARHLIRSAVSIPGKLARKGPGAIGRLIRKSVKWLLLATVPRALQGSYSRRYNPQSTR